MVSIQIRNLTKRFGGTTALDNVSLRITAGELFFLLGPSGCGKTTLLRHIAGFYTPNSGQVLFDSNEVTYTPPHERNTAMMFQSYALWPHMTVAKNVAFGLEERKVGKNEIEERVAKAMNRIIASRQWKDPQRRWLERIAKQLKVEVVVDREALDSGQFKTEGGFDRINKVFDGKLESLLGEIGEEVWKDTA